MPATVQAVLFDRERWSSRQARAWLQAHGKRPIKQAHATAKHLRYRLASPKQFDRFVTKHGKDGVAFVIGFKNAEGAGIKDFVRKAANVAVNALKAEANKRIEAAKEGPRQTAPPAVRRWIETNGERKIASIAVYRQPVQKVLEKALNAISLGSFNKAKANAGYDDLFHLYGLVKLDSGQEFRLEKNHVAEARAARDGDRKGENMQVPTSGSLTVRELVDAAVKRNGAATWTYDAAHNNCQNFWIMLLEASHLLTPELRKFIKQDASSLVTGYTHKFALATTNLAGRADILIHGKGAGDVIVRPI